VRRAEVALGMRKDGVWAALDYIKPRPHYGLWLYWQPIFLRRGFPVEARQLECRMDHFVLSRSHLRHLSPSRPCKRQPRDDKGLIISGQKHLSIAVKFSVFNRETDYQRLRPVQAERGYVQTQLQEIFSTPTGHTQSFRQPLMTPRYVRLS
jgi:hypothetical protein